MRTYFLLAATFLSTVVPACLAQEIRVAAAADLQFALTGLAMQYEKQSGTKVSIVFGSSGNFFAQLENGAPFDVFFSADSDYPRNSKPLDSPNPARSRFTPRDASPSGLLQVRHSISRRMVSRHCSIPKFRKSPSPIPSMLPTDAPPSPP